jgi:hypothetical protein
VRLTDRIHLVGGGSWGGAGLSPNPDCHVYLVDGGDALALVDAGSGVPGSWAAIGRAVADAGFALEQVEGGVLDAPHRPDPLPLAQRAHVPNLAHRTSAC